MIVYDDVTIAAPGNLEPRRVPVASVQASWEINGPGSFSGFVRLDDLRRAGLVGDVKGYWLTYATAAGPWGGVITGRPTTGAYAEIVAQGFVTLVEGRVLTDHVLAMGGSPGGLAKRALTQAGAGAPTFLAIGSVDEGGGPLGIDLAGDVARDILPHIAEAGDVEWIVGADRVFRLARRLGHDRSAIVRLVEDRHVIEPRINDDLAVAPPGLAFRVQSELSQMVMAITKPTPTEPAVLPPNNPPPSPTSPGGAPGRPPLWERRDGRWRPNVEAWQGGNAPQGIPAGSTAAALGAIPGMAEAWQGQLQTYAIEVPGVVSAPAANTAPPPWSGVAVGVGANNPAVPSRRHAPPPTVPVELTLTNRDDCFLAFDIGDTVRVDIGSVGVTGRFRAMTKALDVASQTLTVAGELLKDG